MKCLLLIGWTRICEVINKCFGCVKGSFHFLSSGNLLGSQKLVVSVTPTFITLKRVSLNFFSGTSSCCQSSSVDRCPGCLL